MTISTENGTAPCSGSRLSIEAIQTIVPQKPTDQKQSYKVQLQKSPIHANFQTSFQLVICHKALDQGNYSGWVVAGWFKESLGRALVQEPIFAGRLRRLENGDNDGDNFEIVTNDSGVRMVEANIQMNSDEFLDLKGQTEAEADLVFWENINEENPQYSPLCFVQVTNFKCGGFSIGISCSLLATDPLSILSFIEKWSDIHKNIVSSNITQKTPLFYFPNLGRIGSSAPLKFHSCKGTKKTQSVIFSIEAEKPEFYEDGKMYKNLGAWCLDQVEQKDGKKLCRSNTISLFLKEASGKVKIESFSREEVDYCEDKSAPRSKFSSTGGWDCLRVGKYFCGGSNQSHASMWINSECPDEGLVMVTPSLTGDGLTRTIIMVVTGPS